MTFVKRFLDITFSLGEGSFGTSGSNTLTLSSIDPASPGPRVSAHITGAGGAVMPQAEVRIFGMTLGQMNELSTLGLVYTLWRRNTVAILARDVGSKPSAVFSGTILEAWVDATNAPDVCLHVQAATGYLNGLKPAPAVSFQGSVDITTVLQTIASNWTNDDGSTGIDVQNNGVSAMLNSPYYTGSPRPQMQKAIHAVRAEWNRADDGTIRIWKPGDYRTPGDAITISKTAGMIGYPSYTANGVMLRTLFNNQIRFGSKVSVESILFSGLQQNANSKNFPKIWAVNSLTHDLESNMPDGRWESTIQAVPPGLGVPSQP